MKDSISEQSFYIESDEDDQEKQIVNNDHNEDGSDSDSSNYSNDDNDNDEQLSKSIITSWPQSYRLGHSTICRWKFFLSVYGYLNFGSDSWK